MKLKFIEFTDRFDEAVVVNMEQVEYMYKSDEGTMLQLTNGDLYVKETLEQVKLKLGV